MLIATLGETFRANKELVGIIVTSACLGTFGALAKRKNTIEHNFDRALIEEVLANQKTMHRENREDIKELKDDIEVVNNWMIRHQALHDGKDPSK